MYTTATGEVLSYGARDGERIATKGTRPASIAALPLAGVNVLDFTRFLPGALATQLLADLGADVTKVEGFPEGDYARGMSPFIGFASINRNKRSIHVDFRREAGAEIVRRLIAKSDALVEVSRPGAMSRYGLDYESVLKLRADIVYCSISAYGQSGPDSGMPSHGYNMDGLAGMLDVQTGPDGTPFVGPMGHLMPSSILGAHAAALGITAALLHRAKTGEGTVIDASCWDCGLAGDPITSASALSGVPMADGFASRRTPKYAPYRTSDGRYLMACVIEHKFWTRFCEIIGRTDLSDAFDAKHSSDLGDSEPWIYDEIAGAIVVHDLAHWSEVFGAAEIPVTPVRTRLEALTGPHAQHRAIALDAITAKRPHRMAGPGLVIAGVRGRFSNPAPELGADTIAILRSLSYSTAEIEGLTAEGIVSQGLSV